jgi:hypothetical protein
MEGQRRNIHWVRIGITVACLIVCALVITSTEIGTKRPDTVPGFKIAHRVDPPTVRNVLMNTWGFFVPCWFLVMVCVVFAGLPWLGSLKRFSLRTMLIITTASP